jgi:hypothetical protein
LAPLLALAVTAAASTTIYVITEMTPDIGRGANDGYSAEGGIFRYANKEMACEVEVLLAEARGAYFRSKGYEDPLRDLTSSEDFFAVRARFENRMTEHNLTMMPGSVMFENCNVRDETHLYQLLYMKSDGEKRLEAAGAVLYLKQLDLPPGTWIERLFLFQYDDPYKTKRMKLVISNILAGEKQHDLEFPFIARYKKEKI